MATIPARPRPDCYLCGAPGELLHEGLADHLFGVPGQWSIRRCRDPRCGLAWLDPLPEPQAIGLLYRRYYTHGGDDAPAGPAPAPLKALYGLALRLSGARRARQALNYMYLRDRPPGRALDVGCGDGTRIARLQRRGWTVEGQEVDERAAELARTRYGATVHMGDLAALRLPDAAYDAVYLNHVIEHLTDPIATLSECHRLLRPGGVLVAATPNLDSLGHRRFGRDWRGLEPPRHFHLFSPVSLKRVAERAGFRSWHVHTTAAKAETFAAGSLAIAAARQGGAEASATRAMAFQLAALLAHRRDPDSGEECVLEASP